MFRPLTPAETELARSVFGHSIDYPRVRVHRGRLIPLLQNGRVAMSPFGTMHFPPSLYRSDFAAADISAQHLFIHEMTHIWQHALGLKLWLDGSILACKGGYKNNICYRYHSQLAQHHTFSQFNMEQQADIIADYFVFRHTRNHPQIQKILADFSANPANRALLPAHTDFPAVSRLFAIP
ncbi:type IV secretion protein Rhs [Conchiformibius steedae DSM 2580]|uniref:Type IV secretion protein Rhs n=1 Tax=Conchiformibius steedae DSM 2580 TaxID=1121352 RepID=A0AAE9KZL4_9NEIS|nr:hypothetical protein [Conchiformibius steedae]QMT33329.1 type IV secretion protein Rhs [Conchiformibius steedae]URD67973.1 type IV secretion protein Rhs [Conchiformibius steedae DSM 2580]